MSKYHIYLSPPHVLMRKLAHHLGNREEGRHQVEYIFYRFVLYSYGGLEPSCALLVSIYIYRWYSIVYITAYIL